MFEKLKRKVNRVFIHCSASDVPAHDNVATIREWHLARGFSDVGYHFFIRKDGTVEEGRSLKKTPAGQKGNNTKTIAICLHGLLKDKFTEEQFSSLRDLCGDIDDELDVTFHGHCEVSVKSCPVFDYKEVLRLDEEGNILRELTREEQFKADLLLF